MASLEAGEGGGEMFQAFVTISGEFPDTTWDYIDVYLMSPEYETFEEAERWYERVYVERWGTVALTLHANHPELTQIEAEYDIYEDGDPVGDLDWFVNEAIWWEE